MTGEPHGRVGKTGGGGDCEPIYSRSRGISDDPRMGALDHKEEKEDGERQQELPESGCSGADRVRRKRQQDRGKGPSGLQEGKGINDRKGGERNSRSKGRRQDLHESEFLLAGKGSEESKGKQQDRHVREPRKALTSTRRGRRLVGGEKGTKDVMGAKENGGEIREEMEQAKVVEPPMSGGIVENSESNDKVTENRGPGRQYRIFGGTGKTSASGGRKIREEVRTFMDTYQGGDDQVGINMVYSLGNMGGNEPSMVPYDSDWGEEKRENSEIKLVYTVFSQLASYCPVRIGQVETHALVDCGAGINLANSSYIAKIEVSLHIGLKAGTDVLHLRRSGVGVALSHFPYGVQTGDLPLKSVEAVTIPRGRRAWVRVGLDNSRGLLWPKERELTGIVSPTRVQGYGCHVMESVNSIQRSVTSIFIKNHTDRDNMIHVEEVARLQPMLFETEKDGQRRDYLYEGARGTLHPKLLGQSQYCRGLEEVDAQDQSIPCAVRERTIRGDVVQENVLLLTVEERQAYSKRGCATVRDWGDPRSSRSHGGLGGDGGVVMDSGDPLSPRPQGGSGEDLSASVSAVVGEEPSGGKEEEDLQEAMDEKVGIPAKQEGYSWRDATINGDLGEEEQESVRLLDWTKLTTKLKGTDPLHYRGVFGEQFQYREVSTPGLQEEEGMTGGTEDLARSDQIRSDQIRGGHSLVRGAFIPSCCLSVCLSGAWTTVTGIGRGCLGAGSRCRGAQGA